METAIKIMRTDPQTEQSLVFVENIRLKCDGCGVIVQPSDLERTLWADNGGRNDYHLCPSCIHDGMIKLHGDKRIHVGLSTRFNGVLESQAQHFESEIIRLESELTATRLQYEQLITEGQQWTDKYQWIDKRVIRLIEGFKQSDDFDLSELDF